MPAAERREAWFCGCYCSVCWPTAVSRSPGNLEPRLFRRQRRGLFAPRQFRSDYGAAPPGLAVCCAALVCMRSALALQISVRVYIHNFLTSSFSGTCSFSSRWLQGRALVLLSAHGLAGFVPICPAQELCVEPRAASVAGLRQLSGRLESVVAASTAARLLSACLRQEPWQRLCYY